MGSIRNAVHYCSVSKGNRTLFVYSGGDPEVENLAALCLERTPAYHKWYFETIGKRTFGFLIEDGYVYFTIVDKDLGKTVVLRFLEHLRDEFKKVAKKGSKGSFSSINSIIVQEQLVPIVRRLIHSLEHVSRSGSEWKAETSSSAIAGLSPSPSNANGQTEVAASTKVPLLGKSYKQDRKKSNDHHAISMREIDLEDHRRSQDRGVKLDSTTLGPDNQGGAASPITLQKDMGSMRIRSSSQAIRKKWWRQVRIVLAIDVAICLLLFVIWLIICDGFGCTR